MPLWMSSGEWAHLSGQGGGGDVAVDPSRYVAFQAADRFSAGEAFSDAVVERSPGFGRPIAVVRVRLCRARSRGRVDVCGSCPRTLRRG